jgi:hypothetical protein
MHDQDGLREPGDFSAPRPVFRCPQRGLFYLALTRETFYKARMLSAVRFLIFGGALLTGCDTVKTAAVGTFRVVDAPARYVREKIDSPETTTTTEADGTSDVATPGRPVSPPAKPSSSAETRTATQNRETTPNRGTSTSEPKTTTTSRKPSPSATPRVEATKTVEFPTARPVPGKPGYVYSTDPQGGIIDVTGYKTGDKAKDPYTKQIFIVP